MYALIVSRGLTSIIHENKPPGYLALSCVDSTYPCIPYSSLVYVVFSLGWRGSIDHGSCSNKKEVPRMGCSGKLNSFLLMSVFVSFWVQYKHHAPEQASPSRTNR